MTRGNSRYRSACALIEQFGRCAENRRDNDGQGSCEERRRMGAADFRDLDVWQLSKELQSLVLSLLDRPEFCRNLKLRSQIDNAVSSPLRNIAEGFGRFHGAEFAQFLNIALGSLAETQNHLTDVCERGYITVEERNRCLALSRRCIGATLRLRQYLLSERNTVSSKRARKNEGR